MECKKYKISKWNLIVFILLSHITCACSKNSQTPPEDNEISMTEIRYDVSSDLFSNPERGFYRHLNEPIGQLNESDIKEVLDDHISLILRVYYLDDFRDKSLSPDILEKLSTEFDIIRKAGLKVIVRFAYSRNETDPDAPLTTIENHLDQLAPVIKKHKDVIALMQAGLIGAWGEWYYTSNKLNTPEARKAVLDKILQVLPADRFVQVRTPGYKRQYTGITTPIKADQAFSSQPIARIGHHNDCFMASLDDYGTYEDVVADKNFLEEEGLFVPMGGETCPPSGVDPADCAKAQAEMRKLRWSYLNQDYYKGVNDQWIVQGCMDDIINNMGYRLVLRKGMVSDRHAPGSNLFLHLDLENVGYAPPYNPRLIELVLVSTENNDTYIARLLEDPRKWQPGAVQKIKTEIALPDDIKEGKYSLYLSLPDPEKSLYNRPEYAIRLGNKDCWLEAKGYNDLNMQITVSRDSSLPSGKADISFVKQ